jgi:replicative DNA helicase
MIDSLTNEMSGPPTENRKFPRKTAGGQRSQTATPSADRLPPHSIEAEKGVLGCIMLAPHECIGDCITKFKGNSEVFYDLRHQVIYQAMVDMYQANEPVDSVTLFQRLKDKQQLESVGGSSYLAALPDTVPTAANLSYYADIVWDKHLLRKMISACTNIVTDIYDFEGEVDRLLDEVETKILRLNEERVDEKSSKIKDLVHLSIDKIEHYHQNAGMMEGLSTGLPDLDKMTFGMKAGEMIIIAARPSMGKTSLAMNIAEHVAVDLKQPVGVFSLEMTSESLVMRLLCSRARLNLRKIQGGFMAERDFPKLTNAAGQLSNSPLFIDDTSGLSILQLRAKARRMHQQFGIKLFVIDYLQLLHSTASRGRDNRQQEIADISNGVKALAKELSVPVIVLSQLNRELEKDKSRKPRMSDLRESGSIEQDADLVGLLYKPASDDEDADNSGQENDGIPVNLLIAKQRNGPTGDVPMIFLKGITRFECAAKVSQDDVPADG